MFLLNGSVLPIDTPFTANEISYPANWLRLSSAEEKAAIGITEEADPVRADDRFYWDGDINNPKDLFTCQNAMISQIKATAGSLLASTDWKIIREAEGVKPAGQSTLDERAAIRAASNSNEALVTAAQSIAELVAVQLVWPTNPNSVMP